MTMKHLARLWWMVVATLADAAIVAAYPGKVLVCGECTGIYPSDYVASCPMCNAANAVYPAPSSEAVLDAPAGTA